MTYIQKKLPDIKEVTRKTDFNKETTAKSIDKNRGTWYNAFVEGVRIIMLRDKASVFRNIYRGEGVQPVLQRYINIVD